MLFGCLVFCVTSCFTPPGEGRKARAGYRTAAPVIAALDKFHEEHGYYPTNLVELVPTYLPDSDALLVRGKVVPVRSPRDSDAPAFHPEESNLAWLWYRCEEDEFSLMFRYVGPGINTCWYDSKTRKWGAEGHY